MLNVRQYVLMLGMWACSGSIFYKPWCEQEDAHEFLLCCLDAVERDSLRLFKRLNKGPFKPGQVSCGFMTLLLVEFQHKVLHHAPAHPWTPSS